MPAGVPVDSELRIGRMRPQLRATRGERQPADQQEACAEARSAGRWRTNGRWQNSLANIAKAAARAADHPDGKPIIPIQEGAVRGTR